MFAGVWSAESPPKLSRLSLSNSVAPADSLSVTDGLTVGSLFRSAVYHALTVGYMFVSLQVVTLTAIILTMLFVVSFVLVLVLGGTTKT